jgi:uncharacterized membrane protein YsdA (DUF1294 family)
LVLLDYQRLDPFGLSPVWTLIIDWLVISGLIGFVLMGIDKARARDGSWRIPERIFFRLALVGGVFGIVAGNSLFHHKTLKSSFIGVILIMAMMWILALVGLLKLLGPPIG